MTLFEPIMFLEESLTDVDAQVYILDAKYADFFKHDNKDLYLMSDQFIKGNGDVLVDMLEVLHRKGILVFEDDAAMTAFIRQYYPDPINLQYDFRRWGDFNFENILEICEPNKLYPTHFFRPDIFPETILDLGEGLEETKSFQINSPLRLFKGLPSDIDDLKHDVKEMAVNFERRERAYLCLELLQTNRILKYFKDYLDDLVPPKGMHKYNIHSYTLTDLGVKGVTEGLTVLGKVRDDILDMLDLDDSLNASSTISDAVTSSYRLLEIRFEHDEIDESYRPREIIEFIDLDSIQTELTDNFPPAFTIQIQRNRTYHAMKKLKHVYETNSTTYFVPVRVG